MDWGSSAGQQLLAFKACKDLKRGADSPNEAKKFVSPLPSSTSSSSSPRRSPKKQLFPKPAGPTLLSQNQTPVSTVSPFFSFVTQSPTDHNYISSKKTPRRTVSNKPALTPSPLDHPYSHSTHIKHGKINEISYAIASSQHPHPPQSQNIPLSLRQELIDGVQHESNDRLASTIIRNKQLLHSIVLALQQDEDQAADTLRNTKRGYVSALVRKFGAYIHSQLEGFSWHKVVTEMWLKFPQLLQLALGLMLPKNSRKNPEEIIAVVPRLGMCYEVRILQSHTTITFIQSQGHKDFKNQHLL